MAQSTAGIKLYYGEATDATTAPTVWTEIPGITGVPSMNSSPAQLETTTLAETVAKTYIAGLMDLGGSFEFPANMTPALVAAVTAARVAPSGTKLRAFKVSFPAPLSVGYWWTGDAEPVRPGEASVDAVATTTVYISQGTSPAEIDESSVS